MRQQLIAILIGASFIWGVYVYLFQLAGTEAGFYGVVTAFLHPFIMVLLWINVLILPRIETLKPFYERYKKGMENIFLCVLSVVFSIHGVILLNVSGYDLNLLLLVPLSVGIVTMTAANTLPKFVVPITDESSLSSLSSKRWNQLIRPVAAKMFIGGLMMIATVFLPESMMLTCFFGVLAFVIVTIIFRSHKVLKHGA